MSSIFLVSLIFVGISFLVSSTLKRKFATYSQVFLEKWNDGQGNSGKDAQRQRDF